MSTHDEGRGFRSLEYRDRHKMNKDEALRTYGIVHFGTVFACGDYFRFPRTL